MTSINASNTKSAKRAPYPPAALVAACVALETCMGQGYFIGEYEITKD
jgi:hypothetical protein